MRLRKRHVKKGNPTVHNAGLFGITDKAKPNNQMRNGEARFPFAWNSKTRKLLRDAMREAEYRKAQVIALNATRQIHYV